MVPTSPGPSEIAESSKRPEFSCSIQICDLRESGWKSEAREFELKLEPRSRFLVVSQGGSVATVTGGTPPKRPTSVTLQESGRIEVQGAFTVGTGEGTTLDLRESAYLFVGPVCLAFLRPSAPTHPQNLYALRLDPSRWSPASSESGRAATG